MMGNGIAMPPTSAAASMIRPVNMIGPAGAPGGFSVIFFIVTLFGFPLGGAAAAGAMGGHGRPVNMLGAAAARRTPPERFEKIK